MALAKGASAAVVNGLALGLTADGPDERRQAGNHGSDSDEQSGIEDEHGATPASHVPYLFPSCNRKIPIQICFLVRNLPEMAPSAKGAHVRRALIQHSRQPVLRRARTVDRQWPAPGRAFFRPRVSHSRSTDAASAWGRNGSAYNQVRVLELATVA